MTKVALLKPLVAAVSAALCCAPVWANPTGAHVINGTASMQRPNTQTLNVTNSPGSIIHWQGFSIGAGEITRFIQQSSASTVLNRVVGADISQIHGQLLSNGRVFLINPAGILIGGGAVIDTGGFVASTINMSNADFLAGKLRFQGDGSAGSIVNQGWIKTSSGGNVILVAPTIENSGLIETPSGELILAAGQTVTIGSPSLEGVQFEVQAPSDSVVNVGKLIADGGAVGVFAGSLKHSGDIRANALTRDEAGRIVLKAQGDITVAASSTTNANGKSGGNVSIQSGDTTLVSGAVSATGSEGAGGTIRMLGHKVGVIDGALVNASGETRGGTILIGGDYKGQNPLVLNAWRTYVGARTTLKADAVSAGDGGKLIVWADDITRFSGSISARGGALSGDGGFVETSGKQTLLVGPTALVDARAPAGRVGKWLLDPKNIIVQAGGGATLADVSTFAANPGTDQTIDPATLMAAGADFTLQADNDVTFKSDVGTVLVPLGRDMTVQAGRSIFVNANITADDNTLQFIANETTAAGVNLLNREAGAATIAMAPGTTIRNIDEPIRLRINSGAGHAGTSGNIVVANLISDRSVSILHDGPTANGQILRANAASLITVANNRTLHLEIESAAGGAASSIGTSAEPIRITAGAGGAANTVRLESHYHGGGAGIFIDGQSNIQIGGGDTTVFGGTIRGVQALTTGAAAVGANSVKITSANTLSQTPANTTTAGCGAVGGPAPFGGGPICAGVVDGANVFQSPTGSITLRGNDMDLAAGGIRASSVVLLPTAGGTIGLAGGAGALQLSNTEINQVTTATYRIGEATGFGDVTSSGNMAFGGNVTVPAGMTSMEFRTGGTITGSNVLDVTTTTTPVVLHAASVGTTAIPIIVNPGTSTVASGTTTGDIYVQHASGAGAGSLSQYSFVPAAGRTVEFSTAGGNLNVNSNLNLPGNLVVLRARGGAGNIVYSNNASLTTGTLQTDPAGSNQFGSGTTAIAAIFNTARPTSVNGGNVTFGNGGTLSTGGTLSVSNGTATFNNTAITLNDAMTVDGTGIVAGNARVNSPGANGLTFSGTGLISNSAGVIVAGQTLVTGTPQLTGRLDTGNLFLGAGAVLTSSGTLNLTGAVDSQINGAGARVNNAGTFRLTNTGNLGINANGSFQNAGTFEIQTDADITNTALPATFTNTGTLTKSGGTGTSTIGSTNNLAFTNNGTINVASGTLQLHGNLPFNNGTIRVGTGTTFHMASGNLMNHGTITGTGAISITGGTNTLVNENIVAPGGSPGTLTINGNYTQVANGILEIELGGTSQGVTYDLMQVNGVATLGGTLNVTYSGGFTGSVGSVYDFMNYNSRTGNFSTFNYPTGSTFDPFIAPTFYRLTLASVSTGGGDSTNPVLTEQDRMIQTVPQDNTADETERKSAKTTHICS